MADEFENVKVSDIYKEILRLNKYYNEEIKKAMDKIKVASSVTLEDQEKIITDYTGRLRGLYAIQYFIDYKSGNLNPHDIVWIDLDDIRTLVSGIEKDD